MLQSRFIDRKEFKMKNKSAKYAYWINMTETRRNALYYEVMGERARSIYLTIQIFLTLTASGSVLALLLSEKLPWLWSIIFFVSEIIRMILPIIKIDIRSEKLNGIYYELFTKELEFEEEWINVKNDVYDELGIHKMTKKIQKQVLEAEANFIKGFIIPVRKKLLKRIEQENKKHFEQNYS